MKGVEVVQGAAESRLKLHEESLVSAPRFAGFSGLTRRDRPSVRLCVLSHFCGRSADVAPPRGATSIISICPCTKYESNAPLA